MRGLAGSLLQYKVSESEAEGDLVVGGDSASGVLEEGVGISPHITNLYIHSIPPSASDDNSAVLTSDATNDQGSSDLRLDSVSAIITARQFSRRHSSSSKGVTFVGDSHEASDHVTLTLDDDDDDDDEASGYPFGYEEGRVNFHSGIPVSEIQPGRERALNSQKNPCTRSLHRSVLCGSSSSVLPSVHQSKSQKKSKNSHSKRRASSAEGKSRNFDRPVRCESFPKLES